MIIGVPKEVKSDENRVGLVPAGVHAFIKTGHKVIIEKNAGIGSGIKDEEYIKQGAVIINNPEEVYKKSDMIIKVKEPQNREIKLLRENQIIYAYLHLAADKNLTKKLLDKNIIGIAYETIELDNKLPLLEPMSEIAGKIAAIMGAYFLAKPYGGKGVLAGGVAGVHSANYLILGGGTAGLNAAKIASGMGARVVVMDVDIERMRYLEDVLPKNCEMIMSNKINIEKELETTDVIIAAVLIPGAKAPKLITKKMLKILEPGSVIVDVAIDQGGCTETSKPTTHSNPTYSVNEITHYCVTNMPGAYPKSSTYALTNATLSYGLEIANSDWKKASLDISSIAKGINIVNGRICYKKVAEAHGLKYTPLNSLIGK